MFKALSATTALFVLTAAPATPALAQQATAPAPGATAQATGPDPNEVICEKHKVVGSRLAFKRVCKTRAQWSDQRLQERQEIDKVQTQRGMKSGG